MRTRVKARLTKASIPKKPKRGEVWAKQLLALQHSMAGRPKLHPTIERILAEDREDRF